MDVSKLPRLSNTDSPQTPPDSSTPEPSAPAPQPPPSRFDPVGIGAEVWFAVIIGLIFMAIGNAFAQYEIGKLTHHPYHTKVFWQEGPNEGAEVLYPDLMGEQYYSDSGLFFFGLSLIIVAFAQVLSMTRLPMRGLIGWGALGIAILATGYNIFVSAKLFSIGIIPVLSLLCVALGGYEVFLQFRVVGPVAKRAG
jgi:hypothetical protein